VSAVAGTFAWESAELGSAAVGIKAAFTMA
jgi:hypothetical protein